MNRSHFVAVVVVALCVVTIQAQERKLKLGKDSSRKQNSDSDSKDDSDQPKQNGPRSIPGTNLKTRTFYYIGVKPFPYGLLANSPVDTDAGHEHRHLFIGNDRETDKDYRTPNTLFTQWEFVPVSSDDRNNWYKLRNRAYSKEYVTYNWEEWANAGNNFLILETNYPGNRSRTEFLFRPIKMNKDKDVGQESNKEKDYYQLILKRYKTGIVAVTYRYNTKVPEHYFLEFVDPNNARRKKYDKGNEMYELSLFTFELAAGEAIDDEEDIEDINIDDKKD